MLDDRLHALETKSLVPTTCGWVRAQDGQPLVKAAAGGHLSVVSLLLSWPSSAPAADCQEGAALVEAAKGGHTGVASALLNFPRYAPRADFQVGRDAMGVSDRFDWVHYLHFGGTQRPHR